MYSTLHKLRSFAVPWQQFLKLLQPLLELRNLYTVVINKWTETRSFFQLFIWRSRLWNSEVDVQGRWLCALVASRKYVRHHVDIRFLQWLLPIIIQFQYNLEFN